MSGGRPIKIPSGCENPTCGNFAVEIIFRGNHGEQIKLETHCNRCGWAKDGEGNPRYPGRPMNVYLGKER